MEAALRRLAMSVYPGFSAIDAAGPESGEEICRWARRITPLRYPSAIAAFIGQSSSLRPRSPYSDIDMLVVLEEAAEYSRTCEVVAGRPLEAQIIGEDRIDSIITFARRSGAPLVVGFAADADVVFDPLGRAGAIQKRLCDGFAQGPLAYPAPQVLYLREGVTGLLLDLGAERPADERIATGLALYDQLCTLFFVARGLWISRGKYAIREIRRIEPRTGDALIAAYAELLAGSSRELIALAIELLTPLGGPLWHGFYSQRNLENGRVVAGDFRRHGDLNPPTPAGAGGGPPTA